MLADFHVHSNFSDDSVYAPAHVARDAYEQGIEALCFTDHVDYGVKPDAGETPWRYDPDNGKGVTNVDYARYFPALGALRELWEHRLSIGIGLEFGVQRHTVPAFERVLDQWGGQLDFVLLSIHQVGDREFWNGDYQQGREQAQIHGAFYEEMLAVIDAFSGWDSLAHMDLIRRYDPYGPYPFDATRDQVAAILEQLIAQDKALEVNTSSWRYRLDDLQPSTPLLKLYRDLGGTLLTLGSDSHKPEHLGAHLSDAQQALRDLGFESFVTYEHHAPTEHGLAE